MNHMMAKMVQLDIRASTKTVAVKHEKPVKLVANPDQLNDAERAAQTAKEQEVVRLPFTVKL
jgi:hypothetical protein